jgi:hypothetical protein
MAKDGNATENRGSGRSRNFMLTKFAGIGKRAAPPACCGAADAGVFLLKCGRSWRFQVRPDFPKENYDLRRDRNMH